MTAAKHQQPERIYPNQTNE